MEEGNSQIWMSKKIAQLTKAICILNSRNEDNDTRLAALSDAYEQEIAQIAAACSSKVEALRQSNTLDRAMWVRRLEVEYEIEKREARKELCEFRHAMRRQHEETTQIAQRKWSLKHDESCAEIVELKAQCMQQLELFETTMHVISEKTPSERSADAEILAKEVENYKAREDATKEEFEFAHQYWSESEAALNESRTIEHALAMEETQSNHNKDMALCKEEFEEMLQAAETNLEARLSSTRDDCNKLVANHREELLQRQREHTEIENLLKTEEANLEMRFSRLEERNRMSENRVQHDRNEMVELLEARLSSTQKKMTAMQQKYDAQVSQLKAEMQTMSEQGNLEDSRFVDELTRENKMCELAETAVRHLENELEIEEGSCVAKSEAVVRLENELEIEEGLCVAKSVAEIAVVRECNTRHENEMAECKKEQAELLQKVRGDLEARLSRVEEVQVAAQTEHDDVLKGLCTDYAENLRRSKQDDMNKLEVLETQIETQNGSIERMSQAMESQIVVHTELTAEFEEAQSTKSLLRDQLVDSERSAAQSSIFSHMALMQKNDEIKGFEQMIEEQEAKWEEACKTERAVTSELSDKIFREESTAASEMSKMREDGCRLLTVESHLEERHARLESIQMEMQAEQLSLHATIDRLSTREVHLAATLEESHDHRIEEMASLKSEYAGRFEEERIGSVSSQVALEARIEALTHQQGVLEDNLMEAAITKIALQEQVVEEKDSLCAAKTKVDIVQSENATLKNEVEVGNSEKATLESQMSILVDLGNSEKAALEKQVSIHMNLLKDTETMLEGSLTDYRALQLECREFENAESSAITHLQKSEVDYSLIKQDHDSSMEQVASLGQALERAENIAARQLQKSEARFESLEQKHEAEIAQAVFRSEESEALLSNCKEQTKSCEGRLAQYETLLGNQQAEIIAKHEEIDDLKQTHTAQISSMNEEIKDKLHSASEDSKKLSLCLAQRVAKHGQELSNVREVHQTQIADLEARQAQELSNVREVHQTQITDLEARQDGMRATLRNSESLTKWYQEELQAQQEDMMADVDSSHTLTQQRNESNDLRMQLIDARSKISSLEKQLRSMKSKAQRASNNNAAHHSGEPAEPRAVEAQKQPADSPSRSWGLDSCFIESPSHLAVHKPGTLHRPGTSSGSSSAFKVHEGLCPTLQRKVTRPDAGLGHSSSTGKLIVNQTLADMPFDESPARKPVVAWAESKQSESNGSISRQRTYDDL